MSKMKIVTIVGTRPELIRLSIIMKKLDQCADHIIVHTGQNYDFELNQIFFDDLSIREPDIFLESAGKTSAETIGNVISLSSTILNKLKPDAVLVLGDTNSCLSVISAKRLKIPTFHMEAGNRCFDMRVPEEINRKIVDHIADINLPYSQIAREYLIAEGYDPQRIIVTGSPMKEVLDAYKDKIFSSDILKKLKLEKNKYFLVSAHREENIEDDNQFMKFINMLNNLEEKYSLPIILSTHPRTRNKIKKMNLSLHQNILQMKPFSFSDYNKLQIDSKMVLSDSGTITEESSILKFNAVNLRNTHERPEGMEEGTVIMTGMDFDKIIQAIDIYSDKIVQNIKTVRDYSPDNVSDKIIRIIHSYTNFVNEYIWKKNS